MSTSCDKCGDNIITTSNGLIEHEKTGYCQYDTIDLIGHDPVRNTNMIPEHTEILKSLTNPGHKTAFLKLIENSINLEKTIFSLETKLKKKDSELKSSLSLNKVYKHTIIGERQSKTIQGHNEISELFVNNGGLLNAVASYNNLKKTSEEDLPPPPKLTKTNTSWTPESYDIGKNNFGHFYIIVPISDNINETALTLGYSADWATKLENEINTILEFGYNNKGWLDFPDGLPKIKIDVQTNIKELSFSRTKNNILTITALTKNTDLKDISLNFARAKTLNKLNKVSHWNCYRYFPFI